MEPIRPIRWRIPTSSANASGRVRYVDAKRTGDERAQVTLAESMTTVAEFATPVALPYRQGSFCSAQHRCANQRRNRAICQSANFSF